MGYIRDRYKNMDMDEPFYSPATQTKASERCYHSHPALLLKDGLLIYGGSCSSPVVKDADVYINLDYGQHRESLAYPWNEGESVSFQIPDMGIPKNIPEFKKMVTWIIKQILLGKKVHVGCIGGHGRTGTVLAAVVATMMGRSDAIAYVRGNYCQKAVESVAQIAFLVDHFGCDAAAPSKGAHKRQSFDYSSATVTPISKSSKSNTVRSQTAPRPAPAFTPCTIWGSNFTIDKR